MSDPTAAVNDQESDWQYLSRELGRRTREPIGNFTFVVYVIVGIVLFGGLGIWIEIVKLVVSDKTLGLAGIIAAIITFFPTLIGSTTLQLVLASTGKFDKVLISFAFLIFCIFLTFAILLPFFSLTHPITVLALGILCSVCAIWVWWITNGGDPTFKKVPPPDAATGGDPKKGLAGTLTGFEA